MAVEVFAAGPFAGWRMERAYDLERPVRLTVAAASGPVHEAAYGYDGASRATNVAWGSQARGTSRGGYGSTCPSVSVGSPHAA